MVNTGIPLMIVLVLRPSPKPIKPNTEEGSGVPRALYIPSTPKKGDVLNFRQNPHDHMRDYDGKRGQVRYVGEGTWQGKTYPEIHVEILGPAEAGEQQFFLQTLGV